MAETQQQRQEIGGVKELVILVGILLTVVAGAIGTYWMHSQGVEAAPGASKEPTGPRAVIPAPPAGVFHADVYFDFKSTRLRADAARVLQETTGRMDLTNAWVVLVQGYADSQGPVEYNRGLAQRRAQMVKRFLVDLGVPEAAWDGVTVSYAPSASMFAYVTGQPSLRDRPPTLLALADPAHSGSAAVEYQIIIQRSMADAENAFLERHPDYRLDDASVFVNKSVVADGCVETFPHRHHLDGSFAARLVRTPAAAPGGNHHSNTPQP